MLDELVRSESKALSHVMLQDATTANSLVIRRSEDACDEIYRD